MPSTTKCFVASRSTAAGGKRHDGHDKDGDRDNGRDNAGKGHIRGFELRDPCRQAVD
jgi:hypothetical protein